MMSASKQMLQPERIRTACALLSIDMLRHLLSHSRRYVAAQLWYAKKEELIPQVEKEVLSTGAHELIGQLSYGNVHAWLKELDEIIDNQNLYDMRQSLYHLIEATPLAFVGILGESVLRNVAAEIKLDATAPKDEVRGMLKDEMQLLGLETFLDKLQPEELQRLAAEWNLIPADGDKRALLEQLVMWVFDIDGGAVQEGEAAGEEEEEGREEGDMEVEEPEISNIEEEPDDEAKEDEEDEMLDEDAEKANTNASFEAESVVEEANEDEMEDLVDLSAVGRSSDAGQGSEGVQEEEEEEEERNKMDEERSEIVEEAEQEQPKEEQEEEEEVEEEKAVEEEVAPERTEEVELLDETPEASAKAVVEVVVEEEEEANPFQQEPVEEGELIVSIDEGTGEEEEEKKEGGGGGGKEEEAKEQVLEQQQPAEEAKPAEAVEEAEEARPAEQPVEKPEEAAAEQKSEEVPAEEEARPAEQMQSGKAREEEREMEEEEKTQGEKEEASEAPVPPSTPRKGRLLANIDDLKPGLTHDNLEEFSNLVLRQYCKDNGLACGRRKSDSILAILTHWGQESSTTPRKRSREEESESESERSETDTSASEEEGPDGTLLPRRRVAKRRRRATEIVDLLSLNAATPTPSVRRSARRSVSSTSITKGH